MIVNGLFSNSVFVTVLVFISPSLEIPGSRRVLLPPTFLESFKRNRCLLVDFQISMSIICVCFHLEAGW